jgi:hypothetical protein
MIQAAIMNEIQFAKSFRICEGIYGRTVSDLDVERAWNRYRKIVLE